MLIAPALGILARIEEEEKGNLGAIREGRSFQNCGKKGGQIPHLEVTACAGMRQRGRKKEVKTTGMRS